MMVSSELYIVIVYKFTRMYIYIIIYVFMYEYIVDMYHMLLCIKVYC